MVSSTPETLITGIPLSREEVVPSRKVVKLPPWLEVAKPRLIPLLLATTLGGMALTEGWPVPSLRLICTLVGGSLAAAAAAVLNCLWEKDLDGRMKRTSHRALPSGRISTKAAFLGAIFCTLVASGLLIGGVNCLAASLALMGLCSYVVLYTAILKPRTSLNIVIGGIAGAIPPLVGAAAATGSIGLGGWWLFTLIMIWTPAHFWALALLLKDDYKAVGIPMLPVIKGPVVTANAIKRYSLATVILSGFGVWALPEGGLLYGILVLPFNARLLQMVRRLVDSPEDSGLAKGIFRWSIFYMFGICGLLVMSRSIMAVEFDAQATTLFSHMAENFSSF